MRVSPLLVLPLLWSLTLSQHTVPYISFMGETLVNHSWVDISQVGSGSAAVHCHTDLSRCCSAPQGAHRGDWFFPDGTRLPVPGSNSGNIFEARTAQRVDLRHRDNANGPTGIYRCDIPTNAVYDATDTTVRESVYMGLYTSTGGIIQESCAFFMFNQHSFTGEISLSEDVLLTVNSDLNGDSPQFTLTCISTGGPATTVTWTRDSVTVTEGTETVLDDPETAQYTHTLTVTGRFGGIYTCIVANNKPSTASADIFLDGIS